jgi:uncharacterized membrane protein YsdA (DUF1294 family)
MKTVSGLVFFQGIKGERELHHKTHKKEFKIPASHHSAPKNISRLMIDARNLLLSDEIIFLTVHM